MKKFKIFKLTLVAMIVTASFGCVCSQNIQPLKTAELVYQYELTKTAFCSDGSDRARNGIPRFAGTMVAKGITYKNYQYVSYFEKDGSVVVARRNVLKPNSWEKTSVPNYTMKLHDRHRKIAIGISEGDGVIHLAFDHHNTPVLNYARTAVGVASNPEKVAWDDTVFKYVPNLDIPENTGEVTYPSFFSLAGTGDMIIYWRTGGAEGGEMNLAHYSSTTHDWAFIGQISSENGHYNGMYGSRGPYHAGFNSDAEGNIHLAWLWREREALRGG